MFDADLSEQHASKYGGFVVVKSKETTWGSIFGSAMSVMSDGAFVGMDLGGGGTKPPNYNPVTMSPRGINLFKVPDDINFLNITAIPIKQNGETDTNIYSSLGKIIETEDGYLAFFAAEKSSNFELNPLDSV